uniref:Uncharacterized protein n=1 Tax=Bionectria ochroleuca TaxID=29856 RepID=A0A0B7KKH8_BIOOC
MSRPLRLSRPREIFVDITANSKTPPSAREGVCRLGSSDGPQRKQQQNYLFNGELQNMDITK